jgi:hypothetical protein
MWGVPTPGVFCKECGRIMMAKELSKTLLQKSVEEIENKGGRKRRFRGWR